MRTYLIPAVTLVALLAFGCGSAKFVEEKTLMTSVTKAMETLTAGIDEADTPPALAAVLTTFSTQMEKFVPQLNKLSEEHPEWEANPPAEMKESMDQFKSASSNFQSAMPKLMQMASQHADNAQLQEALGKFQSVVSGL